MVGLNVNHLDEEDNEQDRDNHDDDDDDDSAVIATLPLGTTKDNIELNKYRYVYISSYLHFLTRKK
jgi:hypothetical protein